MQHHVCEFTLFYLEQVGDPNLQGEVVSFRAALTGVKHSLCWFS